MNCGKCGKEVEPAIKETFEEANEILHELGKDEVLKPTCGDCLALMFGEVLVN